MSNFQDESLKPAPIALPSGFRAVQIEAKSNFHIGLSNLHAAENFHAGNFHVGELNSYTAENFHVGEIDANSNFHAGNFHVGDKAGATNFHAGNFHAGGKVTEGNFHAGKFHAGNFHAGNFHAGNFHAGNFHAGSKAEEENFNAGNFHAGSRAKEGNFHAGSFHAGNFHAGNFHAGSKAEETNFHAGNFHAGNFHVGDKAKEGNFHAGNFHAGSKAGEENFHAGNFHAGRKTEEGNFHAGDASKASDMNVGLDRKKNFHAGFPKPSSAVDHDVSNIINFHAGQSPNLAADGLSKRSELKSRSKVLDTSLSFYASTFDGKPGFNHVEKPANGIYSNVTTSSHQLSVTDIRGSEDQLSLDRDAVLTISNMPDHGNTFTDDAVVVKDFYPEVEQLLLEHVPGAHRVFIFDHTIRRQFGDRGPVLRAHIDQTPASALARIARHLPDEADTLAKGRIRLINFWRPINGTVENYPLAFALSGSVPDTALEPVKHHYPTWTGETYGVGYSEGQNWCYWSKMGNSDALLLQCFDSEKGGRLAHSAIMDPTSTSQKFRASIEVRALIFG